MSDYIEKIRFGNNTVRVNGYGFNGDWVNISDRPIVATATSLGSHSVDISGYLPNDNYTYDVLIELDSYTTKDGSTYVYMGTDLIPLPTATGSTSGIGVSPDGDGYGRVQQVTIALPTKTRTINYRVDTTAPGNCHIGLIAYRRIGTNI